MAYENIIAHITCDASVFHGAPTVVDGYVLDDGVEVETLIQVELSWPDGTVVCEAEGTSREVPNTPELSWLRNANPVHNQSSKGHAKIERTTDAADTIDDMCTHPLEYVDDASELEGLIDETLADIAHETAEEALGIDIEWS